MFKLEAVRSAGLLVFALAVFLTGPGCLTGESLRGVPGGPTSWRIGYRDGCHSGRSKAGLPDRWERDKRRFRADDLYARGWKEGRTRCFQKAKQIAEPVVPAPATAVSTAVSGAESEAYKAAAGTEATPLPGPGEREALEKRIRELEAELADLKQRVPPAVK